jgi:hypothetical protein
MDRAISARSVIDLTLRLALFFDHLATVRVRLSRAGERLNRELDGRSAYSDVPAIAACVDRQARIASSWGGGVGSVMPPYMVLPGRRFQEDYR